MDISIVIPVFNEKESIPELYEELTSVLESLKKSYEIIFINDGSTDGSNAVLENIQKKDADVKVIGFGSNRGKSAALSAGFEAAGGEVIITMDGDLQDDPHEIPKLIEELKKYDLVVGWKYNRRDPMSKIIPSKVFNFLAGRIMGINLHDFNCCFKAYRKDVAKSIRVYGELHRYIPALAKWKGFSVGERKVDHRPRRHGKSKFGTGRLIKGFLDLITVSFLTKYMNRPMHFFGVLGLVLAGAGAAASISLIYDKYFLGQLIGNRPLLLLAILLILLGMQFVSIGLLGELIVRERADYA